MPSVRNVLWMVTENKHKHEEARSILSPYRIAVRLARIPKVEIQSQSLGEIAMHALLQLPRSRRRHHMMIVEDSGLFIEALHGFPGPYSSYAYKTIGVDGVLELLGRKNCPRRAYFESAIAFSEPTGPARLFTGRIWGRISLEPRGRTGFGFDPIFIPHRTNRTVAELGEDFKNSHSHRAAALRGLAVWLLQKRRQAPGERSAEP